MRFSAIISLFISAAVAAPASDSALVDKELYLTKIGPAVIQRLNHYRYLHASTLTLDQKAFLDKAVELVKEFAVDQYPAAVQACYAVFGKEECREIGAGGQGSLGLTPKPRGVNDLCQCNTGDNWCGDGAVCYGGNCGVQDSKSTSEVTIGCLELTCLSRLRLVVVQEMRWALRILILRSCGAGSG